MLIYIDPSISGISGDMMLAALLHLGADEKKLLSVANAVSGELNCKIKVKVKKIKKNGISAKKVEIEEGSGVYSVSRLNKALASTLKAVGMSPEAAEFASKTLDTLLKAEAKVHEASKLHLHELGCADTLVDVAGTAALVDDLGFFGEGVSIFSSPVIVGGGKVRTAHGKMPVPAPVTAEILRKFKIPFRLSGKGELATPTGVALLANLVDSYESELPVMQIDAAGIGAGSFNLPNPNILRIMKCSQSKLQKEFVSVLETSLDDVSGEVLGYTLERLYEEGALDVQIMSTVTKKNRPGYVLVAICRQGDEERLAGILMEETGTLGIRVSRAQRFCINRKVLEIDFSIPGYKGKARAKAAINSGGKITSLKAEYENAKKIARKTGIPLREVIKEIERQAHSKVARLKD